MKRALLLAACLLIATPVAAFAQDAPAEDVHSSNLLTFFNGLAQIAESQQQDCPAMGQALNDYLDQNDKLLRAAAYSSSIASPENELAIGNAATRLGEAAGLCYQDANVVRFFERFVKLAAELDQG
ncbi:MAG: hypothetical protein RBU37_12820 [Myxococcota bacterium]|jgi:hypothetical protein|nr:hypothetical protein [Myxococcota bacterium]